MSIDRMLKPTYPPLISERLRAIEFERIVLHWQAIAAHCHDGGIALWALKLPDTRAAAPHRTPRGRHYHEPRTK